MSIRLLSALFDELPPSVNHLYGVRQDGRRYRLPEVVRWQQYAHLRLNSIDTWKDMDAISTARCHASPLALTVQASLLPREYRRRDLDNFLKIMLDTVCGYLRIDDHSIDTLSICKRPAKPGKAAFLLLDVAAMEACDDVDFYPHFGDEEKIPKSAHRLRSA